MLLANVLQPLISVEEWTLERLHSIGLGWGLAIVGLTVLVRLCTVPLVWRQFHAAREMREHMPQMKRLQAQHKGHACGGGRGPRAGRRGSRSPVAIARGRGRHAQAKEKARPTPLTHVTMGRCDSLTSS